MYSHKWCFIYMCFGNVHVCFPPSEYIILHKQNLKCFTQTAIIQVKAYMYICCLMLLFSQLILLTSQLIFALGIRFLPVSLLSKTDIWTAGTKKSAPRPAVPNTHLLHRTIPPAISAQAHRRKSTVLLLTSLIQHWLPCVNATVHVLFGHYSITSVLEKYIKFIKKIIDSKTNYVLSDLGMRYSDSILYNVPFMMAAIFTETQKIRFHILLFPPN